MRSEAALQKTAERLSFSRVGIPKAAGERQERHGFQICLGTSCEGCETKNARGRAVREGAQDFPTGFRPGCRNEFRDFLESIRLSYSCDVAGQRFKLCWLGTKWQLVPDLPMGLMRLKLFCHR